VSEGHSRTGERIGMNKSGHGKEAGEEHSRTGEHRGMNKVEQGKQGGKRRRHQSIDYELSMLCHE
jgi:hypothetical protein